MPNFVRLAQIEEVENSGELNREENDKKRVFSRGDKKFRNILQNGHEEPY